MALADRWLLPDGMKELLPPLARQVELVRRQALDLFHSWGYELVMPPMAEHLDSLLTGVGGDLGLQTFKVTDEVSGHTLGIRADITPQVARIDAHRLRSNGVSRLCYCGSVLHTRPAHMLASRNPMQLGAELFGHEGADSDLEVISLMLETVLSFDLEGSLTLDLGHVDVFSGLIERSGLAQAQQDQYIDILQRKALPELQTFVRSLHLEAEIADQLLGLARLHGGIEVIDRAEELYGAIPSVNLALERLKFLANSLSERYPEIKLYFDLSELRGYRYHTGVVFAAYSSRYGQSLAKGGRYDQIGADFGRARPATGFSADLKTLLMLSLRSNPTRDSSILAPAENDPELVRVIAELRAGGARVVVGLSGEDSSESCDRILEKVNSEWVVNTLETQP